MVYFAALVSAIAIALLATPSTATPTSLAKRQAPFPPPPPTSSVLEFTLYKTLQLGEENQCWWGAPGNNFGSVPPSELTTSNAALLSDCHTADFYTLRIYTIATGYTCQVEVFSDNACSVNVGTVTYSDDFSQPCTFPSSTGLVDLLSWQVSCDYLEIVRK